jgi:two-component system chemotaxis response regulator CheY
VKTILLVDDSATMLMSMEAILKKAAFGTQTAASGEAALALLQGGAKPNLIITDLNMGAMNGIELIRQARKIPALRFTPILMLTTESQATKRTEAKAAGASGWLVKPVDGAALLQVLGHLLPGGAA